MGASRIKFREEQDFETYVHIIFSLDLVIFSKACQNTAFENLRKSLSFQIDDHFENSLKAIFFKVEKINIKC